MPRGADTLTENFRDNLPKVIQYAMKQCRSLKSDPAVNDEGMAELSRQASAILSQYDPTWHVTHSIFFKYSNKGNIGNEGPSRRNRGLISIALQVMPLEQILSHGLKTKAGRATLVRKAADHLTAEMDKKDGYQRWLDSGAPAKWLKGRSGNGDVVPTVAQSTDFSLEALNLDDYSSDDLEALGNRILSTLKDRADFVSEASPEAEENDPQHSVGNLLQRFLEDEKDGFSARQMVQIIGAGGDREFTEDTLMGIIYNGDKMTTRECEGAGRIIGQSAEWVMGEGVCDDSLITENLPADH